MQINRQGKVVIAIPVLLIGGTQSSNDIVELTRLHDIARKTSFLDRIHFTGHVKEIQSVLAASDIVYAFSKDGEAFGRVPLEAAAASRPVIATHVGATPEIVKHNITGLLVPPSDIDATVFATRKMFKNNGLMKRLTIESKQWVSEFSSLKHANKIESAYMQLFKNSDKISHDLPM